MINLRELNLSDLPWIPLDATAGFPSQPGIYFAIDSSNQVQYIGRSGDVRGRWKRHHQYEALQAIGSVRIAYLFVDAPELPRIETALIQWFRPRLNRIGKTKSCTRLPKLKVEGRRDSSYLDPSLQEVLERWG